MVPKLHPEPVVHSSLGLQALCQKIRDHATCDILDLGPARSGNIEFWSRFNPSIFIADLRSSLPLPALAQDPDSEYAGPDWDFLLGLPEGRSYDVILAWDLLNYIELPALSTFIGYLRRFCRPGTVFFALIFDQKQMPSEITVYGITDESHLRYETPSSELRGCPRHQPRALALAMTQFRTSDSFRLKNGIVEYLFEYEGDKQDPL